MAVDPLPLTTERLVLRRYRDDDRDAFLAMRRHPDVARHQSWDVDYSDDEASSFLVTMTTSSFWTPGEWFQVAIEHNGAFIGDVAFWPEPGTDAVEIGYSLHPDHHGHGYATEAVVALLDALACAGARWVEAGCDPDNARSAALLERVGFTFDEIVDGERIYRLAIAGTSTLGP